MNSFKAGSIQFLESSSSDESDELPPLLDSEWRGKAQEKLLFSGLQFFVTASDDQAALDSVGSEAMGLPYNKNELKATLEEHGGTVVPSVGKESGKMVIYLICDKHARTAKYLYCLAAGIPCVSDNWIKKCIEDKRILNWKLFQLKSGYSLEKETVIEPHIWKPLLGKEIFIAEELCNDWERVLNAAGAIPFSCNLTNNLYTVYTLPSNSFVFVTNVISQRHKNQLSNKGIPVVKPEWIIQSIITGEMADFDGHPDYYVPTE